MADRRNYITIKFQEGPIAEVGLNGCHIEDVILVLMERLQGFQDGPLACEENRMALSNLGAAGAWLRRRQLSRSEQGVEGTMQPHTF